MGADRTWPGSWPSPRMPCTASSGSRPHSRLNTCRELKANLVRTSRDPSAKLTTGRKIASRRRLKTLEKSKSQKVFTFRLFGTFRDLSGLVGTFRDFLFFWSLFDFSGLSTFRYFSTFRHFVFLVTFRLFVFFCHSLAVPAQPLAITAHLTPFQKYYWALCTISYGFYLGFVTRMCCWG